METTTGITILLMIPVLGLIFSIILYFIILYKQYKQEKCKKVIVNKITAYRNKHPRCRYCRYSYLLNAPKFLNIWIHKCDLKDRRIRFFDWEYCGCFCDYFEMENLDD